MSPYLQIDPLVRRRLCIESDGTAEETIRAYLEGSRVARPSTRRRIERALTATGLAHLIRPTEVAAITSTPIVRS